MSIEQAEAFAAQFEANALKLEKQAAAIRDLAMKLCGTQEAISRLGFERTAEELKTWGELAKTRKEELEKKTLDAILSHALLAAQKVATAIEKLTPSMKDVWIAKLIKAGIKDQRVRAAIERLSKARGRAEAARAWNELLEQLGRVKDAAFMSATPDDAGWREKLYALGDLVATLLSWAIKDSTLVLIVTEAQFLVPYLLVTTPTLVLGEDRVEQYTKLAEDQLKSLELLSGRFKAYLEQLKILCNTLPRPCSLNQPNVSSIKKGEGQTSGEPIWNGTKRTARSRGIPSDVAKGDALSH